MGQDANDPDSKRPQLSDLRESGAIEQDADMVCFIHRPEYYKIYKDQHGNDLRGLAEIIIAKHRNGAVGDVRLRFRGEFAQFANIEERDADMLIPSNDGTIQPTASSMNEPADGNDPFASIGVENAPQDMPF